jgi:hypothetical protein
VGGKLCLALKHLGLVCAWHCATANVSDTRFQPLAQRFQDQMAPMTKLPNQRAGDNIGKNLRGICHVVTPAFQG